MANNLLLLRSCRKIGLYFPNPSFRAASAAVTNRFPHFWDTVRFGLLFTGAELTQQAVIKPMFPFEEGAKEEKAADSVKLETRRYQTSTNE